MVTWLSPSEPEPILETIRTWDAPTWEAAEAVALMQGVGPFFHVSLPHTPIYAELPQPFRDRLAADYALNAQRVRRIHDELGEILRLTNNAGIAVMPLKGALLSARFYAEPALRPMADIDLMVRSQDEARLIRALQDQGYVLITTRAESHFHQRLIKPGQNRVVSLREHPDNPRPVEVHARLSRSIPGSASAYELTDFIWAESQEAEMLGARIITPTPEKLLVHLAIHMHRHLLSVRGRIIQLIDMSNVAPLVSRPTTAYPNWAFPTLKLAERALPGSFAHTDLSEIAARTHPRLRRWPSRVPMDERCGLVCRKDLQPLTGIELWRSRWLRWIHPNPQRLILVYGNTPLPLAYGRHLVHALRFQLRKLTK